MEQKNYNLVLLVMLALFLSGCSQSTDTAKTTKTDNGNDEKITQPLKTMYSTITIEHTCIGCGRCVMYDKEHFAMEGRGVKVITNTNLNSAKLKVAVNICPVNAINLS